MKANIVGFSRCEGNHEALEFKEFTRPPVVKGEVYKYWVLCPLLQEPILMSAESIHTADELVFDLQALEGNEIAWFKKMGKKLGVDPATLPNMRWSEFNQLAAKNGLKPVIQQPKKTVRTKKPKRTGPQKPEAQRTGRQRPQKRRAKSQQ